MTKLLVVENEPVIAMDLAECFSDAGWSILGPATSVEDAERSLLDGRPDAAILDVHHRSGQSTLALAERLLADDVRIVFLTGDANFVLPERLGRATVIEKPISSADLLMRLTAIAR